MRIRDEYLAAVQRENLLTTAFERQKQEANQLNESAIEYSVLKRDAESNRQLYQDLLQRLKEAGVSAGLRSSNIRVVDVARTPTPPITPTSPGTLARRSCSALLAVLDLRWCWRVWTPASGIWKSLARFRRCRRSGTIPLQFANNGRLRKRQTDDFRRDRKSESPSSRHLCTPEVRSSGGIPGPPDFDSSLLVWRAAESDPRHQRDAARGKNHS